MEKGHLKAEEREQLFLGLSHGLSLREIGRHLGRDHRVLGREIQRNRGPDGQYRPFLAQQLAVARRTQANQANPKTAPGVLHYVRAKLFEQWSPEQIACRIGFDLPGTQISHETIYQYIYHPANRKLSLWVCLRRAYPKRRKRSGRKVHREVIHHRIFIDQRPTVVDTRQELGHWESDLMLGSRETTDVVSVTVERKTRYLLVRKLPNKTAEAKQESLMSDFANLPRRLCRSLTVDNGTEHAQHQAISRALALPIYFCHPYAAYERGTVENTIGLMRQYLPKKMSFAQLSQRELTVIAGLLNHRPRKCLGFRTPTEALYQEVGGAFPT
jgi:transposase, IS30 family